MTSVIPDGWQDLSAIQRDLLVLLAYHGPANGNELHDRRGEPHATRKTTHTNLATLRDRGLVTSEAVDGREQRNSLSDEGRALVREAVVETAYKLDV